jgi:hypothetical protein
MRPYCKDKFAAAKNHFVFNVRDPVDRFVSSFYWLLFCNPDGGERRRISRYPDVNPWRRCGNATTAEGEIIFHRRKQNVNLLAEALCVNNSLGSNFQIDWKTPVTIVYHTVSRVPAVAIG